MNAIRNETVEQETAYFKYWGKARKRIDGGYDPHLLVYHSLDVAAVAWHFLGPDYKRGTDLANRGGLTSEQIRYVITILMALHDLGKFSKNFQAVVPDLFSQQFPGQRHGPYSDRHDTLGFLLWRGDSADDPQSIKCLLDQKTPRLKSLLEFIVRAGFGHHGIPPKESAQGGGAMLRAASFFDKEDCAAAQAFVISFFDLLEPAPELPADAKQIKKLLKEISWQIAGLAILSDWIGSNSDHFPYSSERMTLNDYWKNRALLFADKALQSVQWRNTHAHNFKSMTSIFPFISEPTPLQKFAETVILQPGPKLFIMEDVTGAGKTEAAITVAARILSSGEADGIYIGLPTMATANAMYGRMQDAYRKLFAENESPSLILSHGARHLSERFSETLCVQPQKDDQHYGDEASASAFCNLWYADNRKKALLADVGVGTIDQALIGVLPARHQSLRLLGLQRKVLIVDEVHAYDPYMQHLLGVLLEAHARSGGTAILLSATIPQQQRLDLVQAFQKGLIDEGGLPEATQDNRFPLVTIAGRDPVYSENVATRREVKRIVAVEFLHTYRDILVLISNSASAGQCICWIRNTVKDARMAYQDLIKQGIPPERIDLFHSRFAMVDRARIEDGVILNYGKTSGHDERSGRILIATQVVEQSLDLDFDCMITDLAPIDLIIQRAGRLHRHVRDKTGCVKKDFDATDERNAPVLTVFCPLFVEEANSKWLSGDLSGTAAVYKNAGVLWLTQRILEKMKGWKMPDNARVLIEAVYGADAAETIPEGLKFATMQAEGKAQAYAGMGHLNALILEKGYCRDAVKANQWDEDEKIPTRLTEENHDVALGVVEDGKLIPYADVDRYAWDWSSLSVSIRDWKKTGYTLPVEYGPIVEALKSENPRLKYSEFVIVTRCSNAALAIQRPISEIYDPRLGWGAVITEEV
jgi:CRISPR-associated endonuclease/helicase Cas3